MKFFGTTNWTGLSNFFVDHCFVGHRWLGRQRRTGAILLGVCGACSILSQAVAQDFPVVGISRHGESANVPNATLPNVAGAALNGATSQVLDAPFSREIRLKSLDDATSAPVVTALAASPDGRFIAIAGDDHAIRILDANSGEEVQVVIGHSDWIRCLAFRSQADGETLPLLYSAGDDGRVLEWTYAQPLQSRELIRLPFAVRTLDISDDDQMLAIGGFSTDVLVWDLSSDLLAQRFRSESQSQNCVQFSPDGTHVACGDRSGMLTVWNVASGERVAAYELHRNGISALAFSRDGRHLTSAGADRRLVRLDLTTGRTLWERELGPSKLQALCVIDEQTVAAAGSDNRIRLYDIATDSVKVELEGHWGSVAVLAPFGSKLISGSFDTTVRIWDLKAAGNQSSVGLPVLAPVQIDTGWQIR